jgi:glycosyltransferase involved in cell wall biosynthesis
VAKRYSQVQLEVVGPYNAYPIEEIIASDDKSTVDHLTPFYLGKRTANSKNYRVYLEKMLSSDIASKVSFTGQISRSELVNRFLNADIFVFPSIWDEGFGIPPVEAMIAGIPVVATRSGAIVETVQDGKTGLLVDKGNALALAEALLQFLENDDLRESMGRAGQQRALDFFTWERIAEKMLQQYQNLYEPASKSSKP